MSALPVEQVSISGLMDAKEGWRHLGRRRWSDELKRQIVSETFVAGASVSTVARRHDVNANQVFKWRRKYGSGSGRFVAVSVTEENAEPGPGSAVAMGSRACRDFVEIDVGGCHRIRVGPGFDRDTLVRVLDVMSSR